MESFEIEARLANYMTVGILHPAAFPESRCSADRVATLRWLASDNFFGALEIAPSDDLAARRETRKLLAGARKIVDIDAGFGLHQGGLSLCDLDARGRTQALELVRRLIDEAYELGAERVGVISGADPGEPHRPASTAALIDSLLELYTYARASGSLELSLKMADRSVDKRFLIGPTLDGVSVALAVREYHSKFGVALNLGHLPLLGEQLEHAVEVAAPVLARVHVGNCVVRDPRHPRYGDTHPRFGIPGGEIGLAELTRFLRALVSVGYLADGARNVVAFEVRPGPEEDAAAIIADSKHALCRAWAQV
jgi:sugar phosphate isomerase/epimerase